MKQQVREGFHARSALGTAATLPDLLSIDMIDDIAKQEPDFLRKMIEPLLKNFCERFFNLIETWRTSFQFLLEDPAMKKKKQLIFFDHQNARAIITSTACASCVSLSFSINLLQCSILSRIRHSLIGSATHYPLNN